MITIFNRKELIITYDMQKQSEVRTLLQNNGIKYDVKVLNLRSPSPLSAGSRAAEAEKVCKTSQYPPP